MSKCFKMETITGGSTKSGSSSCKIRPPINYLKTWKQCRNLEKVSEVDDEPDATRQESDADLHILALISSNYVIMRNILESLCWQDLKLCAQVSKLWTDIVHNIQKDKRAAFDFYIAKTPKDTSIVTNIGLVRKEPLLVLSFLNKPAHVKNFTCHQFPNSRCSLPNSDGHMHKITDYANMGLCYPSNSMLAIYSSSLVYVMANPLPPDQLMVLKMDQLDSHLLISDFPFLCGVFIPKIKDVEVFKFKEDASSVNDFERLTSLMETHLIKCVFLFVGSMRSISTIFIDHYINKIQELQKEPFALGGCAIDHILTDDFHKDTKKVRRSMDIQFVILAISKTSSNPENFHAYSIAIEEGENRKEHFAARLGEFSSAITRRKHSAAIKLSCTDRVSCNHIEETYWSKFFPKTMLVGCYGAGEVGLDCFPSPASPLPLPYKRPRFSDDYDDTYIYSYSTVLIYLTWGDTVQ